VLNQNTGVPVKGYAQGASPSTGTRGFLTGTALPEIEPVDWSVAAYFSPENQGFRGRSPPDSHKLEQCDSGDVAAMSHSRPAAQNSLN
ncbi:MAG: hypothetical protein OEV30_12845, partial [Ignavibacteria bacterium]|nr:hypothetical protein [Ignavibacteria bacterium]